MNKPALWSPMLEAWYELCVNKPHAVAIIEVEPYREWSIEDIEHEARKCHQSFAEQSLQGLGVVLHMPNCAQWLIWFLALRQAGMVVIPVDYSLSPERALVIARTLKAAAFINTEGVQPVGVKPRRWQAGCALVKLTSGSVGDPKGIVFTDTEMMADATSIMRTMGFDARDRNLCVHPLGHSYALGNIVYPLFEFGVCTVIGTAAFPSAIADDIAVGHATVLPTVPVVLEALYQSKVTDLTSLRLVISAAAPLPPALAKDFRDKFGLAIHNFYGSSETGGIAYDRTGNTGISGKGIGQALDGVTVTANAQGRLTITSHAISHYGSSTSSGQPRTYTLADSGGILEDGTIVLHGRSDRMAKIGGYRVDLDALERSLMQALPVVPLAICVFRDALVVVLVGDIMERQSVRAAMKRIYRYRFSIKSVSAIPVTSRGKVDRAKLLALVSAS